jgi:hypothetical protein
LPGGTVDTPIEGVDPLDPAGLNAAPSPEEQQRVADTVTAIRQGDTGGLQPHPYRNLPSGTTGAVLPPSANGYTAYDIKGAGPGRGLGRVLVDNATERCIIRATTTAAFIQFSLRQALVPRGDEERGVLMHTIDLDATVWKKPRDFYDALLPQLGAPAEHGRNANALNDSVIWGGINSTNPPLLIRVHGLAGAPKAVIDEVEAAKRALDEGRDDFRAQNGRDIDAQLQIER